jgi:hypothetical protein
MQQQHQLQLATTPDPKQRLLPAQPAEVTPTKFLVVVTDFNIKSATNKECSKGVQST